MVNLKSYVTLMILCLFSIEEGWAQSPSNLSVTDRLSMTVNLAGAVASGMNKEVVIDRSQWINYSVEINPSDPAASISVAIGSGTLPSGIEIFLEADRDNGLGYGKVGRPTGKVRLSNTPSALINDIGSSSTGRGKQHGHRLTMSSIVTDYALLHSGDYTLYIQYTISQ
ncbi:MAG: hypothetical protein Q8914_03640 [Bacteroidota bacterium]|nr:hypothetical protein [Bacteroidota bacterium]